MRLFAWLFVCTRQKKNFFFVYVKKLIKICGAVKLFERFQPSIYFTYVHKILWSLTFAYSPYFSWCRRASIDKIVFILTFNISYFHKLLYLPAQCNGEENVFSHFLSARSYVLCLCVVEKKFSAQHHTFFLFEWICRIVMNFHGNRMFDLVISRNSGAFFVYVCIWPFRWQFSFTPFFQQFVVVPTIWFSPINLMFLIKILKGNLNGLESRSIHLLGDGSASLSGV